MSCSHRQAVKSDYDAIIRVSLYLKPVAAFICHVHIITDTSDTTFTTHPSSFGMERTPRIFRVHTQAFCEGKRLYIYIYIYIYMALQSPALLSEEPLQQTCSLLIRWLTLSFSVRPHFLAPTCSQIPSRFLFARHESSRRQRSAHASTTGRGKVQTIGMRAANFGLLLLWKKS
jgi:hypothetical protein